MVLEQTMDEPQDEVIKDWLTAEYDYQPPRRGQIRSGVIVEEVDQGLLIDIGLKRDGLVPWSDISRLTDEVSSALAPGQTIEAQIVRPEDQNGDMILSLSQVQEAEDWQRAAAMLESGDVWTGMVVDHNKGGLLVDYGQIRGFVPASHLSGRNRPEDLSPSADRRDMLQAYVDTELPLKVIEVNERNRRLILSERLAQSVLNEKAMERLMDDLQVGQIVHGTVCQLTNFGAFVDLGGAEGLIHISELAWQRVRKPGDVVDIGEEVDVYVLEIDQERKRISLSLKLAQPSPWHDVEERFESGQLVLAKITNVVDFGAFAALDEGLEGLIHDSELGPLPPKETVQRGEEVVLRVLYVDAARERIGLSLTRVSDEERAEFLADLRGEPLESETDEVAEQAEPTEQAEVEVDAEAEAQAEAETEPVEPAAAVDEEYWENLVEHQDQEPLISVE